jgi:tryptophan 2,3-dioxygenase
MSYGGYLKLDELLGLQLPASTPEQHDETLFIIAHQTYELWFKLILKELDGALSAMGKDELREASRLIGRVVEVLKVLTQQLEVLETIQPNDFAKFRDSLRPASGFQSVQFREIEFLSGKKDMRFKELHKDDKAALEVLTNRFDSPSLWDGFVNVLVRHGLLQSNVVGSVAREVKAITKSYKNPATAEVSLLADSLLAYDESFWLWRNHHVGMVERIIGRNVGTGSAYVEETLGPHSFRRSGVGYLKTTLRSRFFPALWAARTRLGED